MKSVLEEINKIMSTQGYDQTQFEETIKNDEKVVPNEDQTTNIKSEANMENLSEEKLKLKKVKEWNEDDIKIWAKLKKINSKIIEKIQPANGETFCELNFLKLNAPDFFFQTISSEDGSIEIFDVAQFVYEFKKLFL